MRVFEVFESLCESLKSLKVFASLCKSLQVFASLCESLSSLDGGNHVERREERLIQDTEQDEVVHPHPLERGTPHVDPEHAKHDEHLHVVLQGSDESAPD